MQVILHTGVHCTDDDRLLKGLLRNADAWRHEGISIPGPSNYRQLLFEAVNSIADGRPTPAAREVLLDAILSQDPEDVKRLVLSHPNFFCVPKLAMQDGMLYRHAERRLRTLRAVFAQDDLEVHIGLRDFATWIPAILATTPVDNYLELLHGADPMQLRWSDLIRRIRTALPEVPITVWANEDTPLIWGQLLRRLAGIALDRKIIGAFDMLQAVIAPEGMQRFRAFLKENPDVPEPQKRKVMAAFMGKYALDEEVEQELDLPGWDTAYVDMLTELYDEDMYQIARLDGVTFVSP
ncbi:hypothetical protein [Tropicibacter oceani]|uniref:Uncharacterized protein n=1 Tax=Tropicibacter oceani TaxID=3058420 RepID=A0ABY8QGK6_9RHOB|nr:hypothetical protein [Tropicibacter oceani]WGW03764.1 hypothetical protein QF118_17890 [Tropicibacter oceani]